MDSKQFEQKEKGDPSEETLKLTNCLKELTILWDFRLFNGVWKKYHPHYITDNQYEELKCNHLRRRQIEESPDESESPENVKTESTSSNNSIDVPAINFKRYMGATWVCYKQMGQASHIQIDKSWNLEETVKQAEQKFTTDSKTIAAETTDDLGSKADRCRPPSALSVRRPQSSFLRNTVRCFMCMAVHFWEIGNRNVTLAAALFI